MLVCIKCPLCWASTWLGWCQLFVGVVLDTDGGGGGFLRVFAGFVYLIRVFSGLLPGWVGFQIRPRIAFLKHARTEVCSKNAEHAKMLVFYLKAKAMMIRSQ